MGCFRKALDRHGSQLESEPDSKNEKGNQFEKQKPKFAGMITKKNQGWVRPVLIH
jgi:hypothetical protein